MKSKRTHIYYNIYYFNIWGKIRNTTDTYLLPLHFHSLCSLKKNEKQKTNKILKQETFKTIAPEF